jgi:hypothetical protein
MKPKKIGSYVISSAKDTVMDSILNPKEKKTIEDSYSIFDESFLKTLGIDKSNKSATGSLESRLKQETNTRKQRYADYKEAAADPVIGQAIEMMADDATQFDVDREVTVWVESDDKKYAEAINGIINDYIDPFIDTLASCIISKGEFAFKVNKEEDGEDRDGFKDVVLVPYKHIEKLHHLILPNQDRFFYICPDISQFSQKTALDEDSFHSFSDYLHFINYSLENSEEYKMSIPTGNTVKEEDIFILQGESIIAEKVLDSYKTLKALEAAIVQYRLAKSKLVRFVNVEVSRLTDDAKAQNIVNYVHESIVTNEMISSGSNGYESNGTQAEPVVVTIPVKNGVGGITIQEFASDVNIKDIADLDYFMNKIFAGLRTPRSYFNFDEALPGGGMSGTSLVRMDIRYARAVKKVQRVIINGIKELILIFNEVNGIEKNKAPKVKIKIIKVASAEDSDRYTEFEQRLAMANQIMSGLVDPMTGEINLKLIDMYLKFFTHVIPINEMVIFLNSIKSKTDIKSKPEGLGVKGTLKTTPNG